MSAAVGEGWKPRLTDFRINGGWKIICLSRQILSDW
jgi:hypothetical protein